MATNRLRNQRCAFCPTNGDHAYRQRGATPRDSATSTTGLDGKLEGRAEPEGGLARSDAPRRSGHQRGYRASMGRGMSAVGRGPTADIPFVKTKNKITSRNAPTR